MRRAALTCLVLVTLLSSQLWHSSQSSHSSHSSQSFQPFIAASLAQTPAPPDAARATSRAEESVAPLRPAGVVGPPPTAYWDDAWRGWHFYEEPEPEPSADDLARRRRARSAAAPRPPAPSASVPENSRAPELVEFEQLQKTLEEFRNIAIMRPTEANVRRYMAFEASVVARASYFADVAQRVAWSTPELDPSVHGRPLNAKALEVFEQRQRDERSSTAAALGRDHVLFFFFRSDCPYCHAFAPTLRAFEERHGLQVVPVSLDGGPLPSYASVRKDNGIASALNVTQVPAVFLAHPFSGTITPIGFGVLSESQLLERIATVSTPESHAMLPGATRRLALP